MTKILIIGGGGMIGQKLARQLAADGWQGQAAEVTLYDLGFPSNCAEAHRRIVGDLGGNGAATGLAATRPDIVFHLAAIVSGEAEQDFDKGWQMNMFAGWSLLEALRGEHEASGGSYHPRVVFSSSIAVFGAPFPDQIGDDFLTAPLTSYGAQKAIFELMLSDFSRKGYVDGVSIRLPTICVRPGKANKAASSFFSSIIREPLNGRKVILQVPDSLRHYHASPRSAVGFLSHAAALDTGLLEGRLSLNMPGLSCTVAEQIEALGDIAGAGTVDLIRSVEDPEIAGIVGGWPQDFDSARATALGFRSEASFRDIIQTYIDDDLGHS
ncbi:MAG: NAD-dependent epimerase/dehydratase family protein [Rhodobacteraceae bacterium]|nr:NAD-dependent epimerase/dehydratase family protein [Paracoccaceae bacterium]